MNKTKLLCLICLLCLLFTSCSAPNIDWSTWEPTKQTTKAPDSTTAPPEEGGQDIPVTSATYVLTKGELVDGAAVGNTIVLTDSAKAALQSIVANGATDQTKITACGKNILKIPESLTTRTKNNINFAFDSKLGTVSISSTGATASTLANAESAVLNGTSVSGVLFSFRFATDTHITISANCTK